MNCLSPTSGAKGVELRMSETLFRVGPAKVVKANAKRIYNFGVHRIVDARNHFDVARVVPDLPSMRR